jgi:hypothetical protein
MLDPAVETLLSSTLAGWGNSVVLGEQAPMGVIWLSEVSRPAADAGADRPQPEFVWSRSLYRARKAAEEFSQATHADY